MGRPEIFSFGVGEEVVGREMIVAEILIERSVKLIRSATGDDVDHSAAASSELRAIAIGHDFDLLRAVGSRREGKIVVFGKHDADAIEHEIVGTIAAAVDGDIGLNKERRRIIAGGGDSA